MEAVRSIGHGKACVCWTIYVSSGTSLKLCRVPFGRCEESTWENIRTLV